MGRKVDIKFTTKIRQQTSRFIQLREDKKLKMQIMNRLSTSYNNK